MTFGEKLQELRKARGWSQEELAGQIHVSRQALSKWESGGAVPDTENIIALSRLFGVTTDYLLLDEVRDTGQAAPRAAWPKPRRYLLAAAIVGAVGVAAVRFIWAAVAAARAAVVGGFKGTANLLAAQLYGLKAIGTAAHCFTLVHDSERDAFESQIEALGKNTTLLVDTYNIEEAVKTAVEVAGPELGGVRIDSGDLAAMAQRVRNQLDALGATNTTITVTNDLDEYALAALQTAPVDSYGVGTMLVTGSGAPTCAMVYKLTEREGADGTMVPVMKKSKDKATVPGRKLAFRSYEYALAEAEHVISGSEEKLAGFTPEPTWKNLLVDFVDHGHIDAQWQGHDAIMAAHDYHAKALSELPITAQSLMKGEPVIPTETQVL